MARSSGVMDDSRGTEGVGEVGAVQEQWVAPVGTLRRMQAEGKLTEADVYEVDELID